MKKIPIKIRKELRKNFDKLLELLQDENFLFYKFGRGGKWFEWSEEIIELGKKYDGILQVHNIFFTDLIIMALSPNKKYIKNKTREFKRKLKKMGV